MIRFNWLSSLFRKPAVELRTPDRRIVQALSILTGAKISHGGVLDVRRFAVSADSRYCGLTLNNYESYAVDLAIGNYLHYPTAGVIGFSGSSLVLSPDEERFSLEPSGYESFEVDLQAEFLQWQSLGMDGQSEAHDEQKSSPSKPYPDESR
jgi:hypothetical protein